LRIDNSGKSGGPNRELHDSALFNELQKGVVGSVSKRGKAFGSTNGSNAE
jgi:hypothetical protein